MATEEELQALMDFDHVIEVFEDGRIAWVGPTAGIYAPTYMDDYLDSPDEWTLLTGYTGQHGYNGPVMHESEYIGGGLARDILATPGIYVAITVQESGSSDDEPTELVGWAIAKRIVPTLGQDKEAQS